jgi:hypothetical protein
MTLSLTVTQTQRADRLTPAVFRLLMEVEFTDAKGKQTRPLNITKRVETFSFKLSERPKSIKLDPKENIPIKMVKIAP